MSGDNRQTIKYILAGWSGNGNKNIDEPLLHLMVKSGLYRIGFSLESAHTIH